METDNQRFNNQSTVHAYIRSLAGQIEEPDKMMEFLNACNLAQAALVFWLFEGNRYERIQLAHCQSGVCTEMESREERETVWNEYSLASEEFQLAKAKLNEIISKLDMLPVISIRTDQII